MKRGLYMGGGVGGEIRGECSSRTDGLGFTEVIEMQ